MLQQLAMPSIMEGVFVAQDILDDLTTTIQQHLFSCSPSTKGRNSWVQTTRLQHCFLITPQRIGFFTMHCIISNLKAICVPSVRKAVKQSSTICAAWVHNPEELGLGKETRKDTSHDTCHSMCMEDSKCVIYSLEECPSFVQYHHCVPWN